MKLWCGLFTAVILSAFACDLSLAGDISKDWPGWRNADRSGRSNDKNLVKSWPKEGPPLLWTVKNLGDGYSTPSVADGLIYLMGTKDDMDHVIAINQETHAIAWETPIGKKSGGGGYPGPRATPTIDDGKLYTLGPAGDLACLDAKTGKPIWNINIRKTFAGRTGSWEYAESPLIDGDKLIISPGGEEAVMVALNKTNGEVIWKSTAPDAGVAAYASAIIADFKGKREYIQFMSKSLFAVDAETGKQAWSYTKCANRVANCPTPIYQDGFVFCASGYGNGGGLVELKADGSEVSAKEVYFSKEMVNHHGGVVLVDNYLYGTNEKVLLCMDFKTGEIKWKERSVGKGSIAYADGNLYVRSERGPIALVEANPKKYVEKGRFDQPDRSDKQAWPHPVIVGGKLYIRDQENLFCFEVAAK